MCTCIDAILSLERAHMLSRRKLPGLGGAGLTLAAVTKRCVDNVAAMAFCKVYTQKNTSIGWWCGVVAVAWAAGPGGSVSFFNRTHSKCLFRKQPPFP